MTHDPPAEATRLVLVSGLPRSGTSLMMQMLEAGGLPALTDGVRAADDDNPRGYLEWQPIQRVARDPDVLSRAAGHATKVVSALLRELPSDRNYRVIFMERDVAEVRASQSRMLERLGRSGADDPPEQVEAALRAHLSSLRNWLDAAPNFEVLRVAYGDAVSEPEATAARVAAFLAPAIELDAAAMAGVVDPSLYRTRRER